MKPEVEKIIKESFTRIGDGCYVEATLLKAIEDFKVRSIFRTLQASDKSRFNFVIVEEGMRIWNCESLVKEIKTDVKPNLVNFKFQALKNDKDVFVFRSAYFQSELQNAWQSTEEKSDDIQ